METPADSQPETITTMSRATLLSQLVTDMSPPSAREIIRASLKAFTAAEHAEWMALQNAKRQRTHYAKIHPKPNGQENIEVVIVGPKPNGAIVEDSVSINQKPNDFQVSETVRTPSAKEAGFSLDSLPEENPCKKEKPLRGKKKESPPCQTEAEWLDELQADETYRRVNVRQEAGKCRNWCKTNGGKPFSKRRFINWINRALDMAPMNGFHAPVSAVNGVPKMSQDEIHRKLYGRAE